METLEPLDIEPLDIELALADVLNEQNELTELRKQNQTITKALFDMRDWSKRVNDAQRKINISLVNVAAEQEQKIAKLQGQVMAFVYECGKASMVQDSQPRVPKRKRVTSGAEVS